MIARQAFVAVLALVGCAHAAALHGTVLQPPAQAKALSLIDQDGRRFNMSAQRGRVVALFFGFTHCADVCPQTFARLNRAAREAPAANAAVVMVTVDPHRDGPAALRNFIHRNGGAGFALRGSPSELRSAYRAYGIDIEPRHDDIGHTDTIFLIDRSGRLRELLDPTTRVNLIAEDLRTIAS